jgi:hypothetical protein
MSNNLGFYALKLYEARCPTSISVDPLRAELIGKERLKNQWKQHFFNALTGGLGWRSDC